MRLQKKDWRFVGFGHCIILVLLLVFAFGGRIPAAQGQALPLLTPLSPSAVLALESQNGNTSTYIEFVNHYGAEVVVYWINYTGQLVFYAFLAPGQSYVQQTYLTHPWIIYDQSTGLPIEGFLPISQEAEALITKPAINNSEKLKCATEQVENQSKAKELIEIAIKTTNRRLAASFYALAAAYEYLALQNAKCAVDPPDPNYQIFAVPSISPPSTVTAGNGVTSAEAYAFNALLQSLALEASFTKAAVTSSDRALGAADAGDTTWQDRQTTAAQLYITSAQTVAAGEPALLAQLQAVLAAEGISI